MFCASISVSRVAGQVFMLKYTPRSPPRTTRKMDVPLHEVHLLHLRCRDCSPVPTSVKGKYFSVGALYELSRFAMFRLRPRCRLLIPLAFLSLCRHQPCQSPYVACHCPQSPRSKPSGCSHIHYSSIFLLSFSCRSSQCENTRTAQRPDRLFQAFPEDVPRSTSPTR